MTPNFIPNPISGSDIWEREDLTSFNIPPHRIWTLVDSGEDDSQWAIPGWHLVNRFGYAVSREPWTDPNQEVRWDD